MHMSIDTQSDLDVLSGLLTMLEDLDQCEYGAARMLYAGPAP